MFFWGINFTLTPIISWNLPTDGAKTLNGLILDHLEVIPEVGTSFLLEGHPIEVVQIANKAVKMVRIQSNRWQPKIPEKQDLEV